MLQVRCDLDLGPEPLGTDHRGQLGTQHLDCDLAVVPQVLGEIDRRHAALAQFPLDAVATAKCGRQPSELGTHFGDNSAT